jgi:hypothetical protein
VSVKIILFAKILCAERECKDKNLTYEQNFASSEREEFFLMKIRKNFFRKFFQVRKNLAGSVGDLKYYIIWLGKCQDTHSSTTFGQKWSKLGGSPDLPFFSKISNFLRKKKFFLIRFFFLAKTRRRNSLCRWHCISTKVLSRGLLCSLKYALHFTLHVG